MNERIVRIVQKMSENVQHFVETVKSNEQRLVKIVPKMSESVVQNVEMEK